MWIKQPEPELKESMSDYVNFLYQEDKIFVMDNHLAAGWAWINSINPNESNNLFHIDKHYDLCECPNSIQTEIIENDINLETLSFQEYLEISQPTKNGEFWPLFRWDNYILNLQHIYPDIYSETFFATFKGGTPKDDFIDNELDFFTLMNEFHYWIDDNNWIVNIDIDYFFNDVNDQRVQMFTDELIENFARNIMKVMDKINVLTICLSPDCCIDWDNSLRVTEIFCRVFEIDFITEFQGIVNHT